MKSLIGILAAGLFICSGVALAQSDESPAYRKCLDDAQTAVTVCQEDELNRLDAVLEKVVQATASKLKDDEKSELKTEEDRWLAWRNEHCAFTQYREGSIEAVNQYSCLLQVTDDRIRFLSGKPLASGQTLAVCINRAGVNAASEIACYDDEYRRVDHQLNESYRQAVARVSDKAALKQAQRQWIKQRDAQCPKRQDSLTREGQIEYLYCVTDLAKKRTNELQSIK